MKVSSLFLLFVSDIFLGTECKTSFVSDAIASILEETFNSSWTQKLHVIQFGEVTDVTAKILKHLPDYIPVKLIDGELELSGDERRLIKNLESKNADEVIEGLFVPWNKKLIAPSVLLFESLELFKKHTKTIKWLGNRWFRYRHIVHVPGLASSDILESIEKDFDIDNVAFLMNENEKSIELVSSFMFTTHACHKNQFEVINRYNNSLAAWETNDFFPEKYKNFHNCSLAVARTGFISKPEVFVMLAESFNFNMIHTDKTNLTYDVRNDPNTTDLIEEISHLLWSFGLKKKQKIFSTPLEFTHLGEMTSYGGPLTQFEKMFKMFETEVWIAIGVTIAFWLVSIQIINRMPLTLQNFFYGSNIRTPTVNLMNIFMNGGQFKVPKRNFSRFLLLLFVTWSTIIRTCYQSKLFEFLQMDIRSSVDLEMLKFEDGKHWSKENLKKLENYTELERCDVAAEFSNDLAVFAHDYMLKLVHNEYRSGVSSLYMRKRFHQTWYLSMKFLEFSPFFQEFNEKVGQIMSSGLLKNWYTREFRETLAKTDVIEDIGPQVLTMDQLDVAFIACFVPLVLAVIAFILEFLKSRLEKVIRSKKFSNLR